MSRGLNTLVLFHDIAEEAMEAANVISPPSMRYRSPYGNFTPMGRGYRGFYWRWPIFQEARITKFQLAGRHAA